MQHISGICLLIVEFLHHTFRHTHTHTHTYLGTKNLTPKVYTNNRQIQLDTFK